MMTFAVLVLTILVRAMAPHECYLHAVDMPGVLVATNGMPQGVFLETGTFPPPVNGVHQGFVAEPRVWNRLPFGVTATGEPLTVDNQVEITVCNTLPTPSEAQAVLFRITAGQDQVGR